MIYDPERIVFAEIDDEGVATVWLNRPESLNAWSRELRESLVEVLQTLRDEPRAKGVILTGKGRGFCAGADMKNPDTHRITDIGRALEDRILPIPGFGDVSRYPKPIIAAVNGWAVGAGTFITTCCDWVYAAESAKFRTPQVSIGIMPMSGSALRLARIVGSHNALEMIVTGRVVTADEALRMGLVQRVLPDAELLPYAREMMRLVVSHPPYAVMMARESMKTSLDAQNLPAAEAADMDRAILLSMRRDTEEAHQAWRDAKGVRHG
jgi:enoyl-CoA hydratase/carnithine racemase